MSVVDCFRRESLDFCFVQETMISNKRIMSSFSSRWRGSIYWSPAIGRRGGVAIFLSEELKNKVVCWRKDADGRVLSILVNFNSLRINLINVYAPTVPAERAPFFQSFLASFFQTRNALWGGTLIVMIAFLTSLAVMLLLVLCYLTLSPVSLCEMRRALHPRDCQFTWFTPDLSVASRLDTFLVPRGFISSVSSCDIALCVFSDHDFVFLNLVLGNTPRVGPGVWKINNSLLDDETYCDEICTLIDRFLLFKHTFDSVCTFWESLKDDIKSSTISFSCRKRIDLSRQRVLLTNRLISAKNRLTSGDLSAKSEIVDLEVSLRALISSESECEDQKSS